MAETAGRQGFEEKAFFEYHLYTLPRKTDVPDKTTQQITLFPTAMGVDVDRVIVITFFLGSALAGAAGVLFGLTFTRITYLMGFTAGLKGFTAAVLGGIGSIPGAMLGGLLLGLSESLAVGFISPTYKDLIAFLVLILVLLVRPTGLLGARVQQKV